MGEIEKPTNMTLRSLIEKLEAVSNKAATVYVDWCHCLPDRFHSYRGYYEDLGLTFKSEGRPESVKTFLKRCRGQIGETHHGWKGGEYTATEETRLWVSKTGTASGWGIVDIATHDTNDGLPYIIILKTAYCEDYQPYPGTVMADVDDIINHWRNLIIIWADEPTKTTEIANMERIVNYCDALKARVEELTDALKPFAKEAQRYVSAAWNDDDSLTEHDGLTVAHFREALNVFARDSQK